MNRYLHKVKRLYFILFKKNKTYTRDPYIRFVGFNFYSSLLKNCIPHNCIKTNVEICFNSSLKFGTFINDAVKIIEDENYHIRYNQSLHIEVIFFRMSVGNHRVKCQMHFFKNRLFLYNFTFSDMKEFEINEIFNVLQIKYLPNSQNYSKQNIIDDYNNYIQISNEVELRINYLSLNSPVFNKITLHLLHINERESNKNNNHYNELYNRI